MISPASAIHPKGPPMLVSLVTGARRFANRILKKSPNKSSPVEDVGSIVAHRHEGGGAHGVASVEQLLLPRHLEDLLDHARDIVLGHLIPREVPEMVVEPGVWVEVGVIPAVSVSSVVAQPDIVASVGEDVAWTTCL